MHSWLTLIYKNKTRAGRIPTPQDVGWVKGGRNPRKENVQANLRVKIKRLLKKYGYPPDKQAKAITTVLEQAELIYQS